MIPPPHDECGFEIALICALPVEAGFVEKVFDKFWKDDGKEYGKVPGDENEYTTGAIGNYNVVLAYMPGIGKVTAALVASNLKMSFPAIKLAIIVGICGGVPKDRDGSEIVLGDVIISRSLVQYDFGRQYPHKFKKKDTLEGNIGGPPRAIRAILGKLQTPLGRSSLQLETIDLLKSLEKTDHSAAYPGVSKDLLHEPTYHHKHRGTAAQDCLCKLDNMICEVAHQETCDHLNCDSRHTIPRSRLSSVKDAASFRSGVEFMIHMGTMGSADTVLKSGEHRDRITDADDVIAFEMEGAGVWETFPSIVIKGVCDYADSHKNKEWQNHAAAVATCCMKALLKLKTPEREARNSIQDAGVFWHVPFSELSQIFGRDREIHDLQKKLFQSGNQRAAVCGLGGIGKSRIAWEMANHVRSNNEYSVFWIQASSVASYEKDFIEIGRKLNIPGFDIEDSDRKQLVKQYFENSLADMRVLFILDGADDEEIWAFPSRQRSNQTSLLDYIPKTATRSLLVTTRSQRVAAHIAKKDVIHLTALESEQAIHVLHSLLIDENSPTDSQVSHQLAEGLSYLPLAIVQAAAFMNMNSTTIANYLELLRSTREEEVIELLSEDFEDESRCKNAQNSVASTWLISFNGIQRQYAPAMRYLSFMSCLDEKNIPQYLLPDLSSKLECMKSIGMLRGYSFIQVQSGDSFQSSFYSMHRLVRLAMRNWLRIQNSLVKWTEYAIFQVGRVLSTPDFADLGIWISNFSHAQLLCMAKCDEDLGAKNWLRRGIGMYLTKQGRYRDAVSYLLDAVSWSVRKFGEQHAVTYEFYHNLGECYRLNADFANAEKYLTQAYEGRRQLYGVEYYKILISMNSLAMLYEALMRFKQAEALAIEALEIAKRVYGVEHRCTSTCMNNLSMMYYYRGRLEEAEELSVEAVTISKRILGAENLGTLVTMNNLALIYYGRNQLEESEKLGIETLEATKRLRGVENDLTLKAMGNLAMTYACRGKLEQAEELGGEAVEVATRLFGPEHPDTLVKMNNLGLIFCKSGKYAEAEALGVKALDAYRRVVGASHYNTLRCMNNLAWIYWKNGHKNEGIELISACVAGTRIRFGPNGRITQARIRVWERWTGQPYEYTDEKLQCETTVLTARTKEAAIVADEKTALQSDITETKIKMTDKP